MHKSIRVVVENALKNLKRPFFGCPTGHLPLLRHRKCKIMCLIKSPKGGGFLLLAHGLNNLVKQT